MEQRSDEWFKARAGKVTASRIADVMARTKTGYGAGRKNYMAQLTIERLTGEPVETYSNAAMQWGTDTEPFAREAYEAREGVLVIEEGFVPHPSLNAGASPDGLVGNDGLIEIKCPNSATHIETIRSGKVEDKYLKQMQFQMLCCNRAWCDFLSFDPRLPEGLDYWLTRVERDDKMIEDIEAEVEVFLMELDDQVKELEKLVA